MLKKIDIAKARSEFHQSKLAGQRINVGFAEDLDLTKAGAKARDEGAQYIEIEGYASTPVMNDKGFMIAASAWDHPEAFERLDGNPIVLFGHDGGCPVGQVLNKEARPEGLWVKLRIRYNAMLPTQEKIGDVIADGTLRALSIGIDRIIDFSTLEADDTLIPVVTKLVLGEISVVSVGSDRGALTTVAQEFEHIFQLASITDEVKGGNTMWKILAKKYGMGDNATEEQVTAEYQRREQLGANAIIGLGLDPATVTAETLTSTLAARDPKLLENLNLQNKELQAKVLVTEAVNQHKIAEKDDATMSWALSYAQKDPDGFKAWANLQKSVTPIVGTVVPGSGAANGGPTSQGGSPFITKEDREICLAFGTLTPEQMDTLAETAPNEALGWVVGQKFPPTAEDKLVLERRRRWDAACGVPAR